MNSLFNIAGYCVQSVKKTCTTCSSCIQSVGSKKPLKYTVSTFTRLRCYNANTLFFVNKSTFTLFVQLENIYRHYRPYFDMMRDINLHKFLFCKFNTIPTNHILNCYNLRQKLMKKFATVRLKFKNNHKRVSCNRKYYDSKSMAMYHGFK